MAKMTATGSLAPVERSQRQNGISSDLVSARFSAVDNWRFWEHYGGLSLNMQSGEKTKEVRTISFWVLGNAQPRLMLL